MLAWMTEVLRTGTVTTRYPRGPLPPTGAFRGFVRVLPGASCGGSCRRCEEVCPVSAVYWTGPRGHLDHARCLRCGRCREVCPEERISFAATPLGAVRRRGALRETVGTPARPTESVRPHRILARSLTVRTVDAGSCGACEAEIQALANPYYDCSRLGISFTPTPKHADLLLVTGPVTAGMLEPLRQAYLSLPAPRLVVAAGACAASGGPFPPSPLSHGALDQVLPVDVYVPGCPPHPLALLEALLLATGRGPKRLPGVTAR
jgi:Ni,Fe-hydrogenase III small subunit/NAD-dependent dihydropyrimidine dehydrogenase PreA subunit